MSKLKSELQSEFEPNILAFTCNWCSYAGADIAGLLRLQYPANVKIIRLMCSGRVDPVFVLEAFKNGVDGVLITGCHPGECNYVKGNLATEERVKILKMALEIAGIEPARLRLEWIAASEGEKFARVIREMTGELKRLGPGMVKP